MFFFFAAGLAGGSVAEDQKSESICVQLVRTLAQNQTSP